jgi:hypothetical protein
LCKGAFSAAFKVDAIVLIAFPGKAKNLFWIETI